MTGTTTNKKWSIERIMEILGSVNKKLSIEGVMEILGAVYKCLSHRRDFLS